MPAGRLVFFDTSYFVAALDVRDNLHAKTTELTEQLFAGPVIPVTTDAVLIELGNFFSGTALRRAAGVWLDGVRRDPGWEIMPIDSATLLAAEARYHRHDDKNWSMTDCISMEVMERRRIREVATSDGGFAQAGFTPLMA
jgi:predicted nucleic acid-binding protein